MDLTRREVLGGGAAAIAGSLLASSTFAQGQPATTPGTTQRSNARPAEPGRDYMPVIVPNGNKPKFSVVDGVKVFHLVAEEYEHEFAPGLKALCWGHNRQVNANVIEAVEGDRVRIYVTNKLPAPTTVHWHGFILPNGMDGVSGLTQRPIPPGETWVYEFDLVQHGTFMFHSHHDTMTQEGLGLTGMFVIHPREPYDPPVDRDFAIMLHEWRIDPGSRRPNPNEMTDFNVLTMNGRVFPFVDPLVVRTGQRVRMRLCNLSAMDHHPIHLHGYEFHETAMDGQRIPEDQQRRKVTTLVGVGETRDIEFDAVHPGDWAFHCHMTHHIMNQMGHEFPNMIGVDPAKFEQAARSMLPGYMTMGTTGMNDMTDTGMAIPENSIPMLKGEGGFGVNISLGGMAGFVAVRDEVSDEQLTRNAFPGWYEHPEGTVSHRASAEQLRRDGIRV